MKKIFMLVLITLFSAQSFARGVSIARMDKSIQPPAYALQRAAAIAGAAVVTEKQYPPGTEILVSAAPQLATLDQIKIISVEAYPGSTHGVVHCETVAKGMKFEFRVDVRTQRLVEHPVPVK